MKGSDIVANRRLEAIFKEAFDNFLKYECKNISSGVSERNLCGRLALYLEKSKSSFGFGAYHADVEYNRKQDGQIKTILDGDLRVVVINCDLIFHSRGEIVQRDNLVAVEMKKSGRPQAEKNKDRERLRALTKSSYDDVWSNDGKTNPEHVCGYELGLYIELDAEGNQYLIERFEKGAHISKRRGVLM